ncbi:hypothetical protein QMK33_14015 [Hymenobacter sp. H14-R3]|uniref:hypothetical protein n=1 Tax=Hymenobacter sp. H14-R3 TaxID=3046308 RepID=UPI0024B8D57F|nr:hypothetical protein [Hymenobacter sp. H14-R3]MDJ0366271.1 hypothetical protein [Hymenobacter sp. H14-R3]
MHPVYWRRLWLLAGLVLLMGRACAQVPAALLGQWELRQISFVTDQGADPALLARMDNPEVAALNRAVTAGTARLLVTFRPDGTYAFSIARPGQPVRNEIGTYFVRDNTLFAQSPATAGGSSFDHQRLVQVGRRKLVVEFLVGEELPGVLEEVEYRRPKY